MYQLYQFIHENTLEIFFSVFGFFHHLLTADVITPITTTHGIADSTIFKSTVTAILAGAGTHIVKTFINWLIKKIFK